MNKIIIAVVVTMMFFVYAGCAEGGAEVDGRNTVVGLIRDYCSKNSELGIDAALTSDLFTRLQGSLEVKIKENERGVLSELQIGLMNPRSSEMERLCMAYVLMSNECYNTSGQSIELIIDMLEGNELSLPWRERMRMYLQRNCILTAAQKKRANKVATSP